MTRASLAVKFGSTVGSSVQLVVRAYFGGHASHSGILSAIVSRFRCWCKVNIGQESQLRHLKSLWPKIIWLRAIVND